MSTTTLPAVIALYIERMREHINTGRFSKAAELALSAERSFDQSGDPADGLLNDAQFYIPAIVAARLIRVLYTADAQRWENKAEHCPNFSEDLFDNFVKTLNPRAQYMYPKLVSS